MGRKESNQTNKQTKSPVTLCMLFSGVSKVFLVAKLKPLVAKQNRASLARGGIINFSISTCYTPIQSLDQLLLLKSGIGYQGC